MLYQFSNQSLGSHFSISNNYRDDRPALSEQPSLIHFLWNRNDIVVRTSIDGLEVDIQPNQMTTVTYNHHLVIHDKDKPLHAVIFNREFYCIADHDSEVGCNGILFFGAQDLPLISIKNEYLRKFDLLWDVLLDEFRTKDKIQGEMLQMLLKRFIILATRLAKKQLEIHQLDDAQVETIRKFNFLVDLNFKTKKKVKDYADLLFKSPKTLSNIFAVYNQKSPSEIIQDRIILEAKRLLFYSDKQNQEIAFELGYEDPAHFSKFFKKNTGLTPTAYRISSNIEA